MKSLLVVIALGVCTGTFNNPCRKFPVVCPNDMITYLIYNSISGTLVGPYELKYQNDASIISAPLNLSVTTIIMFHGYTGNRSTSPNDLLLPALTSHGDYNIIVVDYEPLALGPCYPAAVINIRITGKCTAEMIIALMKKRGMLLNSVQLIGHSLGAHVAGDVSKQLMIHGMGLLERITGLDPALPSFTTSFREKKLEKSDAKFVDIIHTNALDMGKLEVMGHVDFYVNGGLKQPGCESNLLSTGINCHHRRSVVYYAESLNRTTVGFYGTRCKSLFDYAVGKCRMDGADEAIMGHATPSNTRGLYFVTTNDAPPYAKGNWTVRNG